MPLEPIAITGCGAVSAFGNGVEALWAGLAGGRSAVGRVTRFDASSLYTQLAAEVPGPLPPGTPEEERAVLYLRRAVAEALADARVPESVPRERVSVAIGTTLGGMAWGEAYYREGGAGGPRVGEILPRLHYHVLAQETAQLTNAEGEVTTVSAACASSLNALSHACLRLRAGRDDVAIAGGADALSAFVYSGFCSLLALAPDAARPFDRRRKGLVLGEGAGVLVLERLSDARRRGARVRALVTGCGTAGDAHHLTGPHKEGEGLLLAMRRALAQGEQVPDGVGYVNAHGTSTPFNDRMEYVALSRLGGADWARRVPVSSTKAATGHALGAAGAIETIACVRALETGVLPPSLNFEVPDPECPVDPVPNEAREVRGLRAALNLAAGFGGQNAALLLERAAA
ncbi:MAG: beta-ketoacyl-[acyl-carrier-protein] synthase family protein [Planctomycetales bacterium]|nr:beta-ketoacyl-[acyl-carrier-protein] synthase family protein [Planctomycetales bacterium]